MFHLLLEPDDIDSSIPQVEDATVAFTNTTVLKTTVNPIVKYLFTKSAFKTWIKYTERVIQKQKDCERIGIDYVSDPTDSESEESSESGSDTGSSNSSFESSDDSENQLSYDDQQDSQTEGRDSIGTRDEQSTSRPIKTKLVENMIEEFNENEESKDSIEEPVLVTAISRNDASSNKLLISKRPESRLMINESFGVFEPKNDVVYDPESQSENQLDTIHSPLIKVTSNNREEDNDDDDESADKNQHFRMPEVEELIAEASFRDEASFRRQSLTRSASIGMRNGVIKLTINNQIIIQNNIFVNNISESQSPREESSVRQRHSSKKSPRE